MLYVFIILLSSIAASGYYYLLEAIACLKEKSFPNAIDNIIAALISYLLIIASIYFAINLVGWEIHLELVLFSFIIARVIFACKELLWNHYLLLKNELIITSNLSKITLTMIGWFDKDKENNTKLIEKIKKKIISNTFFLVIIFTIIWFILLQIANDIDSSNFKLLIIFLEILYYLIMIPVLTKKFLLFKSEVIQKQ